MVGFEMANSRETLHPGRILLSQAMEPLGISRNQLARDIDVPVGRISDITNGKRGVTADTALRLGRYFGTGPELWLRLQAEFDLYVARRTTWPAVENRVRVLTSEALVKAPVAALVDAMPSVDESAIEKEVFVGTDPEPPADEFGDEPGSESDSGADPYSSTAELFERPEVNSQPESSLEESNNNEAQKGSPQDAAIGSTTGDVDGNPGSYPAAYTDREEELSIPPIPDRSKLYQSG
jgi:addiction module HigA family antidote